MPAAAAALAGWGRPDVGGGCEGSAAAGQLHAALLGGSGTAQFTVALLNRTSLPLSCDAATCWRAGAGVLRAAGPLTWAAGILFSVLWRCSSSDVGFLGGGRGPMTKGCTRSARECFPGREAVGCARCCLLEHGSIQLTRRLVLLPAGASGLLASVMCLCCSAAISGALRAFSTPLMARPTWYVTWPQLGLSSSHAAPRARSFSTAACASCLAVFLGKPWRLRGCTAGHTGPAASTSMDKADVSCTSGASRSSLAASADEPTAATACCPSSSCCYCCIACHRAA